MQSAHTSSSGVTWHYRHRLHSMPPIADTMKGLTGSSKGLRLKAVRKRRKGRWVWAVAAMLIVSSLGVALVISPGLQRSHTNYDLHSVILIEGDSELQAQAVSEGWPGEGSPSDPFVIEGYEIAAMGHDRGVYIRNTSSHLVIENCYVHDPTYSCISLSNVTNATITRSNCVNGQKCIEAISSSLVNITANNCSMAFGAAIELVGCEHSAVIENNCSDSLVGLSLVGCGNMSLALNSAYGNVVSGVQLTHTVTSVLANNTCTGGQFGVEVSSCGWVAVNDNDMHDCDESGIVISSCNDCDFERNRCSGHGTCGISLEDSTGCRLRENEVSGNADGIRGARCDGCSIRENECSDNDGHGITLEDSVRCTLSGNSCSGNEEDGICIGGCQDTEATENTCERNGGSGLRCDGGLECYLGHNACAYNGAWGMRCDGLQDCSVSGNSLTGSPEGGLLVSGSSGVNASDNRCSETGTGLMLETCVSCHIFNNTVDRSTRGIAVIESVGISLRRNSMNKSGLALDGALMEQWDSHDIDSTNLVNGLPVAYIVSALGIAVPGTPGQVILVGCVDVAVAGMNLSNATVGVQMAFCEGITISDCICSDGYVGVYGYGTSAVVVEGSTCNRNARAGVEMVSSMAGQVRAVACLDNVMYGVRLNGSTSFEVEMCYVSGSAAGIFVEFSPSAGRFADNTVFNCTEGVVEKSSSHVELDANDIVGCDYGVRLLDSTDTVMTANSLMGCGLYVESHMIGCWDSHTIGPDNSVNGRTLVYLVDESGMGLDASTGQAVIVSCHWITAASLNLSRSTVGVQAAFSDYISVLGCNLSHNVMGVEYSQADDGEISMNQVTGCLSEGVKLKGCTGCTIEENTVLRCDIGIGIYDWLSPSSAIIVGGNNASENLHGIQILDSCGVTVERNTLNDNLACGVMTGMSERTSVIDNTCNNSGDMAVSVWGCTDCLLANNTCSMNARGMYLWSSSECNVSGNFLYGSREYGVCLDSACTGNRIWDNILAYNNGSDESYDPLSCQAHDDGVGNWWNSTGVPHGLGNYWHDWTAPDDDMDGCVDSPYNISGAADARDLYPVANASVVIEDIPEFGPLFAFVSAVGLILMIARRKRD